MYEDFTALGGSTPTHSCTDDADICRRQHEQGVTCVAIWSRNKAAVAALCGSRKYNNGAHISTSRRIHTVASTKSRCGVKQTSPPLDLSPHGPLRRRTSSLTSLLAFDVSASQKPFPLAG